MSELDELRQRDRALLEENAALDANLVATQNRCTVLLNENRKLRRHIADMKSRWAELLDPHGWEQEPDDGEPLELGVMKVNDEDIVS